MRFAYHWVPATFISRPNRFIAWFRAGEADVKAHVPNTGRLRELLVPGAEVLLSLHQEPRRKTDYELRLVKSGTAWVSIDSQLPNRIVEEGLQNGLIDDFGLVSSWRREVPYGNSRLDFRVESDREWLVEVKGVTLQADGWSYFPDAPTERGPAMSTSWRSGRPRGLRGGAVSGAAPGGPGLHPQRPDGSGLRRSRPEGPGGGGQTGGLEMPGVPGGSGTVGADTDPPVGGSP